MMFKGLKKFRRANDQSSMKSGAKNKFVLRILYMYIQLFYYIIQQSVTKQIHQLGKAIFMVVSIATTKK